MKTARTQLGFNLLETLVASMVLSGTVVTVGALSTRALQGVARHRQFETAVQLADRQMRLIDYMGIDVFLEQGQTEGVFEEPAPGYHWSMDAEAMDFGLLYSVTIHLTWVDRGTPRQWSMSTRLNGTGMTLGAEDEAAGQEGGR